MFSIDVDHIHVNQVKARQDKVFGFSQDLEPYDYDFAIKSYEMDGDPLRFKVSGVELDADLKCSITILGWSVDFTNIYLENLAFEILFRE